MPTQLEKTCGNDYSALGKVLSNFTISTMPILGTLYNSAMSVQMEERLAEMEKQIETQELKLDKLIKFVHTDEGAAFFTQCIQNSLSCYKKDRIKIFIAILKGSYESQNSFDIQYQTILMQTISKLTDAEFLLLSYIVKFNCEIPLSQRTISALSMDMEFFLENGDHKENIISFNEFLELQENGNYLLCVERFLLLRLSNLGVINKNNTIGESYYVTPLGRQLLTYIQSQN